MLATVAGVTLAVLLGMASLAVSSYQAYIANEAWRHPVEVNVSPRDSSENNHPARGDGNT